ncbi:MAG: single-stranded DNA-binding protein [Bacteroidota bacterium]|nr:single-stranded DNA-binding protein [Bacteroidota bacterium]
MHGINKVQLIGNVGREPKTKYLESNVAVTTFSLATSETHRRKDGQKVTSTEWHNIVLWRGLAELAEKFVKKGDPIYIEGKLHTRTWTDRDENIRKTTEIVANNLIMLSPKEKKDNTGDFDDINLDDLEDDDDDYITANDTNL